LFVVLFFGVFSSSQGENTVGGVLEERNIKWFGETIERKKKRNSRSEVEPPGGES
jgi:hypothetical protein